MLELSHAQNEQTSMVFLGTGDYLVAQERKWVFYRPLKKLSISLEPESPAAIQVQAPTIVKEPDAPAAEHH